MMAEPGPEPRWAPLPLGAHPRAKTRFILKEIRGRELGTAAPPQALSCVPPAKLLGS